VFASKFQYLQQPDIAYAQVAPQIFIVYELASMQELSVKSTYVCFNLC